MCRFSGLLMFGVVSSVLIWFLVRVLGNNCGSFGGFSSVFGFLLCLLWWIVLVKNVCNVDSRCVLLCGD